MTRPNQVNPDELLASLGRLLAEDAERSARPELEQLTRGELDAQAVAELERRGQGDPGLRAALEAHRPLGADVQERIIGKLMVRRTPAPEVARWVRHLAWATPLALAASLMLLLWSRRLEQPALGPYRAEVSFAASESRSAESAPGQMRTLRVSPGQPIEVLLRPSTNETGEVEAAAFVQQAAELAPLPAEVVRGSSGALRLGLQVPHFTPPAKLTIVLGRPGTIEASLATGAQDAGPGWQRFSFALELLQGVVAPNE